MSVLQVIIVLLVFVFVLHRIYAMLFVLAYRAKKRKEGIV